MEGYLYKVYHSKRCTGIDPITNQENVEEIKISKGSFYYDDDTVVIEYNHSDDTYSISSALGFIYEIDCVGDDPCDICFNRVSEEEDECDEGDVYDDE